MTKVELTPEEITEILDKLDLVVDVLKRIEHGDIYVDWSNGIDDEDCPKPYAGFWLIGDARYVGDHGDYLGCSYDEACHELNYIL